jgi:hypothetical protein
MSVISSLILRAIHGTFALTIIAYRFLLVSLFRLNSNTTTVAYTATTDNPPVFILLF